MARNDTYYYDEIMDYIAHHQEICFTCSNYRKKLCGFAYSGKRLRDDQIPENQDFQNWAYDAYQLYLTQVTGEACEKQTPTVDFLNEVEEMLSRTVSGIDEDTVNYILQRAFRILNKYPLSEELFSSTPIKEDIQSAIDLVMAHIDLDSLEHGANIYQLIKAVEIGYDRKKGLFKIYPKAMAITLMRKCVQQTPEGYYLSTGDFDEESCDFRINKANFVGRTWLDVEKNTSRNYPDHVAATTAPADTKKEETAPESQYLVSIPELNQLVEAGILSKSLQLLPKQSRRSIVEFCHEHELFKPWHLDNWRRINGIISDHSGRKISASSLKQAFQDYQKNHL